MWFYPSDCITSNLSASKTKFLLRSMLTQPLDDASNSFFPKLKILDRTLSSQSMRGQTSHNRLSSSNLSWRKRRHPIWGICSNRVSGIPWLICCPVISVIFYLEWGLTDTSITYSLDEIVWVCIYELCLLRKVVVEIALEIRHLAELFIASCILMQIYSVISSSWCAWIIACLSLVPRLSQHKAMFTYLKLSLIQWIQIGILHAGG